MVKYAGPNAERCQKLDVAAEEDIASFEAFFRKLGNGPLAKPEKAILKTYIFFNMSRGDKEVWEGLRCSSEAKKEEESQAVDGQLPPPHR